MRVRYFILLFFFISSGCTGVHLERARTDFYSDNLARADSSLGECIDTPERSRLLCYMEKGIVLHYMKEYKESTRELLKASEFIRDHDQVSIRDQSTSVMINDMTATYKGEYSERLWIHTFLMMNFLLQYRYDSALVEAKQALEVYNEYPESLDNDYYTRALIALCFENMKQPDGARIEYEKLAEGMGREYIRPEPVTARKGELVLFIARGRVPQKVPAEAVIPPSIKISLPRYADFSSYLPVTIKADGTVISADKVETNMGDVARKSLDDRAAQYIARQAVRAGTKETIARNIGKKNEVLEVFARLGLFLLEKADTRSWQTLPGNLTLVRIILDEGSHVLEISSKNSGSLHLEVDIPGGRRVYKSVRF